MICVDPFSIPGLSFQGRDSVQNTYKLCLGIQDASNFSGVLLAFSNARLEG